MGAVAMTADRFKPYPCPCCGGEVADTYVEGDAECCYCRDINDPRLAASIREARQRSAGVRRCCLRRLRGEDQSDWRPASPSKRFGKAAPRQLVLL